MKVTAILGSPRKTGASNRITQQFIETAKNLGSDVTTHYLNGMKYRGCQGCGACKSKAEQCVQKDDLTEVLTDVMKADVAVFATPVYYSDVTGQFKSFFDRTWSFVKPDYLTNPKPSRLDPGKKAVLVVSQGDVAGKHQDVIERYFSFLTLYGYEVHIIRATGCGMAPDVNVDNYIAQAGELASQIVG